MSSRVRKGSTRAFVTTDFELELQKKRNKFLRDNISFCWQVIPEETDDAYDKPSTNIF